jgi:beta-lactamase regulating signal transducer with metallopeptidase domain
MKPLETFVGSPLAGAIGWAMLHSLWQGAAIAAILALLLFLTGSPRARYIAASAAMLAMVAAFIVTLFRLMPDAPGNFTRFHTAIRLIPAPDLASSSDLARIWIPNFAVIAPWLAPFWLVGVCLLYMQRIINSFSVERLSRRGVCCPPDRWQRELARLGARLRVSRAVRLLESCLADVPMVVGHFRPVILMPVGLLAGLPADQTEMILLHELAHIRRCDYLVNVFQRAAEGLLFYHPAIWWVSKVMRIERENCCDDAVVSIGRKSREYALALAAIERNRIPGREAVVAATGGSLVKRIHRLLYPKAPGGARAPLFVIAILAVSVVICTAHGNRVLSITISMPPSRLPRPRNPLLLRRLLPKDLLQIKPG